MGPAKLVLDLLGRRSTLSVLGRRFRGIADGDSRRKKDYDISMCNLSGIYVIYFHRALAHRSIK